MMRFLSLLILMIALSATGCIQGGDYNNQDPTDDEDMVFVEVSGESQMDQTDEEASNDYVYKHRSTLAGGNDREKYIWELLRLSLEATLDEYGPYSIQEVSDINQVREDVELMHDSGVITIISDSLNESNLSNLDFIQVPLLRNILGYRVFLINEDLQGEFENIDSVESLYQYKFGIGYGWNDKLILEHSGIQVYEEEKYETLFRSLTEGNFEVFSRGVNEILGEYKVYKEIYPSIHIEENIMLYYPLPRYFWFSRSEEGQMLKRRVEKGLAVIIEDGRFYSLFDEYFSESLELLNLRERTIIELENPVYREEFDEMDMKYRYDPLSE